LILSEIYCSVRLAQEMLLALLAIMQDQFSGVSISFIRRVSMLAHARFNFGCMVIFLDDGHIITSALILF